MVFSPLPRAGPVSLLSKMPVLRGRNLGSRAERRRGVFTRPVSATRNRCGRRSQTEGPPLVGPQRLSGVMSA
jgi:hypothetical protein